MKTEVITKSADQNHDGWKKGEKGYIDGYCRDGHGAPSACVVFGNRIEMVPIICLEVSLNLVHPLTDNTNKE